MNRSSNLPKGHSRGSQITKQSSQNISTGNPSPWTPPTRPRTRIDREDARNLVAARITPLKRTIVVPGAPTGPRHSHPHTWADRLKSSIPINGTATITRDASKPEATNGKESASLATERDSKSRSMPSPERKNDGDAEKASSRKRNNYNRNQRRKRAKQAENKKREQAVSASSGLRAGILPLAAPHQYWQGVYSYPSNSSGSSDFLSRQSSNESQAMASQVGGTCLCGQYYIDPFQPPALGHSVGTAEPGLLGHTGVPVQPRVLSPTELAERTAYVAELQEISRRADYEMIFNKLQRSWHELYRFFREEIEWDDAEACIRAWERYLGDLEGGEASVRVQWDSHFVGLYNAQWQHAEQMIDRVRRGDGSHNPNNAAYHIANALDASESKETGESRIVWDEQGREADDEDGGDGRAGMVGTGWILVLWTRRANMLWMRNMLWITMVEERTRTDGTESSHGSSDQFESVQKIRTVSLPSRIVALPIWTV